MHIVGKVELRGTRSSCLFFWVLASICGGIVGTVTAILDWSVSSVYDTSLPYDPPLRFVGLNNSSHRNLSYSGVTSYGYQVKHGLWCFADSHQASVSDSLPIHGCSFTFRTLAVGKQFSLLKSYRCFSTISTCILSRFGTDFSRTEHFPLEQFDSTKWEQE